MMDEFKSPFYFARGKQILDDHFCFGVAIGLDYDSFENAIANKDDPIAGRIKSIPGTVVTWAGNTENSFYDAKHFNN